MIIRNRDPEEVANDIIDKIKKAGFPDAELDGIHDATNKIKYDRKTYNTNSYIKGLMNYDIWIIEYEELWKNTIKKLKVA